MQEIDSECQQYISDLVIGAKTFLNPVSYLSADKKLNVAIKPTFKGDPIEVTKGNVWVSDDQGVLTANTAALAEPTFS